MTRMANRAGVAAVLLGCVGFAPPPLAGQGRKDGAGSCRTGIATYRVVTASPAGTSTIDGSCTVDQAPVEGTCENLSSDSTGRRFTSVSVTRHASRADVVDEVSVNPPLNRALGTTTTVSGAGLNTTSTSALTYDTRGRLTGIVAVQQPGARGDPATR